MRHNISIHALLAESDTFGPARLASGAYFYPRSPCGERLRAPNHNSCLRNNFYPRSPCGERQRRQNRLSPNRKISIHALLAESDKTCYRPQRGDSHFYPRSPCGERRNTIRVKFRHKHFYPRSPCGERHPLKATKNISFHISIHALLAESDELAPHGRR